MTYAITGEATLSQTFRVTNTGDATLPFCVGGHPAFNVPMGDAVDEAFEDYVLEVRPPLELHVAGDRRRWTYELG